MAYAHAGVQRDHRLILVLVCIDRVELLARTGGSAATSGVGIDAKLGFRKAALERRREVRFGAVDKLDRHLIEKARWLGCLVLTEHAAPRSAGENQPRLGPGHSDVTQAALLLELLGVFAGARVGEEPFLQPRQ